MKRVNDYIITTDPGRDGPLVHSMETEELRWSVRTRVNVLRIGVWEEAYAEIISDHFDRVFDK